MYIQEFCFLYNLAERLDTQQTQIIDLTEVVDFHASQITDQDERISALEAFVNGNLKPFWPKNIGNVPIFNRAEWQSLVLENLKVYKWNSPMIHLGFRAVGGLCEFALP